MVAVRVKWLFAAGLIIASCLANACGREEFPRIHDIQGTGDVSPLEGERVSLEDVAVTAVGERGFFVQELENRADDDARTSEGLYVFGSAPPALEVGDRVSVQGRVVEFHGHTQLKPTGAIRVLGPGKPPAAAVLDGHPDAGLEALESMRVAVRNGLIVSPTDEHGDVKISLNGQRPVRLAESPELTRLPEMNPAGLGGGGRILASPRPFSAEGVLAYRFDDFVLWPSRLDLGEGPELPRQVRPAREGEVVLASYNMRLFVNETRVAGEPVVDAATFRRRLSKHAGWLTRVLRCPGVVALQEVEIPQALSQLARESDCGYRAFARSEHSDMGLGYLVGPSVTLAGEVHPIGAAERMPGTGRRLFDRPPLKAVIQTDSGPVTLINVHLRSMRGLGREPRVINKRRAQADALGKLVDRAVARGERVVVLGDFNALPFDDGFVDVLGRVAGVEGAGRLISAWRRLAPGERYSYLYRGHGQMLDHAMFDPVLAERVTGAVFARGNADAPAALARDAGSLLRASDHDPLVIYLSD